VELSSGVLLALLALGGVVAVDATSLGQFMLSRPVVAATLAGWIAGAPAEGALLGLVLEAIQLTVLPVGAARYPEAGPPAVAAAGVYAGAMRDFSTLAAVLVFALFWEWVSGLTVQGIRHLNVRFSPPPGAASLRPGRLVRRHLLAILLDFLRGVVLVGLGIVLFSALLRLPEFVFPQERASRLAVGVALTAALAGALRLFGAERFRLFLAGAAAGALFLLLAR
jgi:mannose/fructose/N-acetylgalactosamine-specific phosphotransferase system component IIC